MKLDATARCLRGAMLVEKVRVLSDEMNNLEVLETIAREVIAMKVWNWRLSCHIS